MTPADDAANRDSGITLIHEIVSKMGFTWYDRKLAGNIIGAIAIPHSAVTERFVLVHSRARDRLFLNENDRGFHYHCRTTDVNHWMAARHPVILICSHPQRNAAWWMHAQDWFHDLDHRTSGRIYFRKRTQRFTTAASSHLLGLVDLH